ncbi:MAG: CIA30 family protein [Bacteroidota bacterium]
MKNYLYVAVLFFTIMNTEYKVDFGVNTGGNSWNVINDGVMGGLSEGEAYLTDESMKFYGRISLANNGGFSSLKSPFQAYDLTDFDTVELRVKSKGGRVAMTMETDRAFYRPYFKKQLTTSGEDWEVLEYDLEEFKQYRLGYQTGDHFTETQKDRIIRIGFITDEKQEVSFDFEVDYILFK